MCHHKVAFTCLALLSLFANTNIADTVSEVSNRTGAGAVTRQMLSEKNMAASGRETREDLFEKFECSCGNNGTCSFDGERKVCDCEYGYKEAGGYCIECNCGMYGTCSFERISGFLRKECECSWGYVEFGGLCKACYCGIGGNCSLNHRGEKVCNCEYGYGPRSGTCTACGCDPGLGCSFDETTKRCLCPKGYADTQGLCKDVDECPVPDLCPASTHCVNKPGSYDCECKEGYEKRSGNFDLRKDGCRDIDECLEKKTPCFYESTICVNTPGSYRCDCRPGYKPLVPFFESGRSSPKYNDCIEDTSSSKTTAIVAGCLCGAIILGLLVIVRSKKRR